MYDLLKAKGRDSKFSPKNLRKQGSIPGVIYGKGFDTVNIQIPTNSFKKFLKGAGKVFEVEVEGSGKHLVSLDDIQKDHFGNDFVHVAFHKLSQNEKATVTLPIHLTGTAIGTKTGGVVNQVLNSVEVKGLPGDMPESIDIDITDLELNAHWTLADVSLPRGLEFAHALEDNIVSCSMPKLKLVEETPAEETIEAEATTDATETPVAENTDEKIAA